MVNPTGINKIGIVEFWLFFGIFLMVRLSWVEVFEF